MAVGAETRHAHALAHLHHVGAQDERGLCDAVFEDAGLGRQADDVGLFVGAHHGVLALAEVLRGRGGH